MPKGKKRGIFILLFFNLLFCILAVRIYDIQNSEYKEAADIQSVKNIYKDYSRGYIYDRNMQPLVNNDKENIYYLVCYEENRGKIASYSDSKFKEGNIISVSTDNIIKESETVKKVTKINRYSTDFICQHIIGYVDSDGYGVCGIEKAFDRILDDSRGLVTLSCKTDGQGNYLPGYNLEKTENNYDSPGGILLTIDKDIQKIIEAAAIENNIRKGCIVVLDASSSEVLGCVSLPMYDVNSLSRYLNDENYPFINRAFSSYPVGSVIKPFIAAISIDNGFDVSHQYKCNGKTNINENIFTCYNENSHGTEDLNNAIQFSCNSYFIEMGISIGKNKIIEGLNSFGFGKKIRFCSTLSSSAGNLPDTEKITSDADLANVCIGQGMLLATPIQIAAAYCVIANKGQYNEPYILKSLINDEGKIYGYYKCENSYNVLEENICEAIGNCLYNNMLNGTGEKGRPCNVSSAGKTATAQTGIIKANGQEQLCTWFAGYFPFENPKYTVVIFNEDGSFASDDCAPVFKQIAEKITDSDIGIN